MKRTSPKLLILLGFLLSAVSCSDTQIQLDKPSPVVTPNGGACSKDAECLDGTCKNSTCVPKACQENDDCDFGSCVSNVCKPKACTQDSQCTDGTCKSNVCVPKACSVDGECTYGTCSGNLCKPTKCTTDGVCNGGTCVDSKCAPSNAGNSHNPQGKIPCTDNTVCIVGECVDKVCKPKACTDSTVCNGGECVDNVCKPKACQETSQCAIGSCIDGQYCDPNIKKKCKNTDECKDRPGFVCNNLRCIPDPNTHDICTFGTSRCGDKEKCVPGRGCVPDCDDPCGGTCCDEGKTCYAGQCVNLCSDGNKPCGGASTCCGVSEGVQTVCISDHCVTPGDICSLEKDSDDRCPYTQYCDTQIGKCIKSSDNKDLCTYKIEKKLQGVLKLYWSSASTSEAPEYDQVMMTPVVAPLDGDDLPDIAFSTFKRNDTFLGQVTKINFYEPGVLRAIKGQTKNEDPESVIELWSSASKKYWVAPLISIAVGDITGDKDLEIVTIEHPGNSNKPFKVIAVNGRTGEKILGWEYPLPIHHDKNNPNGFQLRRSWGLAVSIANIDHKGSPEVIVGKYVLSGENGELLCELKNPAPLESVNNYTPFAADVIEGGNMEIIAGGVVYEVDTQNGFKCKMLPPDPSQPDIFEPVQEQSFSAVAEILKTNEGPEIVTVVNNSIRVANNRGKVLVQRDIASGDFGGGPPTLADFDGDGVVEIGVATKKFYSVYKVDEASGTLAIEKLWSYGISEESSGMTGSSVFDFNGDGAAEAIYSDEKYVYSFVGAGNGENSPLFGTDVYWKTPLTSGTGIEYPVVVDIDRDGHSDMVVPANNYYKSPYNPSSGQKGIYVYEGEGNKWVDTRGIWNQHTYHVVNVDSNGTIPVNQPTGWKRAWSNNFRQNVQTGNPLLAPNLKVVIDSVYGGSCGGGNDDFLFTVYNVGDKTLPKGAVDVVVKVAVAGSKTYETVATVRNTTDIPKDGKEKFVVAKNLPSKFDGKALDIRVEVDPDGAVPECAEDDNVDNAKNVQSGAPDLSVNIVNIDMSNCYQNGVVVTYEIHNSGPQALPANSTNVKIYGSEKGETPKLLTKVQLTEEILPGRNVLLTYTWTNPPTDKSLSLKITVDEEKNVTECREDNNEDSNNVSLYCALFL